MKNSVTRSGYFRRYR